MRTGANFANGRMQREWLEHPTEDALERFILHQSGQVELETIETHILMCESCVARLESLETEVAAMKIALRQLQLERAREFATQHRTSWKSWLALPSLSLAGAVAALTAAFLLVPQLANRAPITDVNLSAYRGDETAVVPEGRRLHLQLNAEDLAEGPVTIELVNSQGAQVWEGGAMISGDRIEVNLPRITEAGPHYIRVYAASQGSSPGDLLREFVFRVK